MMKLLYAMTVSDSSVLVDTQLGYLNKNGYEVTYVTSDGDESRKLAISESVKFIPIEMRRNPALWSDLLALWKIILLIRSLKPNIVVSSTPKAGFLFMLASFLLRIKHRVYYVRGFRHESLHGLARIFQITIELLSCRCSTQTIYLSKSVMTIGLKLRLSDCKRSHVLGSGGSGTNFSLFKSDDLLDSALQARLNLVISKIGEKFVLGFVGRLVERKGLIELYNAFKSLQQQGMDCCLLIIGGFDSTQPLSHDFIELLRNDPLIFLVGPVSRNSLGPFYKLMDVFVFPAHWEGFGNVLIEAAHFGIPIVSTRVTGCVDAVNDGINGILVNKGDVSAICAAIKELHVNHTLRAAFGNAGIVWAKEFNRDAVNCNWLRFLNTIA